MFLVYIGDGSMSFRVNILCCGDGFRSNSQGIRQLRANYHRLLGSV